MNKALQLHSLYGNFTIAVSWRGSHYLCCLCLWKQWSLYGHMGIVLSPSRPIAMFYRVSQKRRLPFEVKRQCRMFEFKCLNSLMSPGMRKTLELGIFMLTLRINLRVLMGSLGS